MNKQEQFLFMLLGAVMGFFGTLFAFTGIIIATATRVPTPSTTQVIDVYKISCTEGYEDRAYLSTLTIYSKTDDKTTMINLGTVPEKAKQSVALWEKFGKPKRFVLTHRDYWLNSFYPVDL